MQEGVFPKTEKNGWTGITFVNTEKGRASVTLRAYDDKGTVVATPTFGVGGHAKLVNMAETIFSPQDISGATYITCSSDKNVVRRKRLSPRLRAKRPSLMSYNAGSYAGCLYV